MNPVLNVIGNMLGGSRGNTENIGNIGNMSNTGNVGNAQANSASGINNILSLYNALRGSANPMQMIQSLAQSNPQVKQALDYINENGGDSQSAFLKLAKDMGIDPNNITNMIK